MTAAEFTSVARRVVRLVWPYRQRLLLVVDGAGWILDEIGDHLARLLPPALGARVVGGDWASAHDCTIHFIDRPWAWRDGVLDRVHPSNRLLGLWWHGRADAPDPDMRSALDRLARLQDRFERIQVTCSTSRETLRAIGVADAKIVQLPEGVDLGLFTPGPGGAEREALRSQLGIAPGSFAVGCFQKDGVGWGDGAEPKLIKGPDVLADAIEIAHRHTPMHAVLPGPARGYLARRLRAAGVSVIAPGSVSRGALARMYHALDAYISPSRDEGGPAGVLEAMASGIPVISTPTGMAGDLIEDGNNGLLVEIGSAAALASAIERMAGDPALRSETAGRAVRTIAAYDWPLVAERYARELYGPLAQRP